MKILVLNTGSSTVKFSLIDAVGENTLHEGTADWSMSPANLTIRPAGGQRKKKLEAAGIRAAACAGLEFLGVRMDANLNAGCRPDADVETTASACRVLVIATREDLTIACETVRVLQA